MAIIIPTNFAQITINYTSQSAFQSGNGATVFGIGAPGNDIVAATNLVTDTWVQYVLPLIDSNIRVETVRGITSLLSHEEIVATAGGRSGTTPPPNVATLVRKATVGRGRRRQGRMYLPGMVQQGEVAEDGSIQGTRLTQLQTAMTQFLGQMNTQGTPMFILHNEDGISAPPGPTGVNGLVVEQRVASQRRRLRY